MKSWRGAACVSCWRGTRACSWWRSARMAARRLTRSPRTGLVFLDVVMPEYNGLEVVQAVGLAQMPLTVFATAYDHYAVAAFDANAVDYLLKPFDAERLGRAMDKVRRMAPAAQQAQVG